jgi:transcriptional regulator with XRE-family HTH domain
MALSDVTKFKIALLKRNLSQRNVARRLDVSDQYLCDMVKGRRRWPPRLVSKMAALGLEAYNLPGRTHLLKGKEKAA